MLAVILESGERDRLYTALSLLVSTAAEGEEARGLLSFGALPAIIAGDVDPDLWDTARELRIPFHACAAAGAPGDFPVISVPRFLKETAGARLVVV
jgi:peroxiredoxin family protein